MRWYKDLPWLVERPLKDTFAYYSDIKSYTERYPRYYGIIEIINESDGIVRTTEFLNLSLDENRDHVKIEVEYQIHEPDKISFKIVNENYGNDIFGGLILEAKEFYLNGKLAEGTLVSGTISALEIISLPPGSKNSAQYEEMLLYFGEEDMMYLEGEYDDGYREGQKCPRCGKGQLRPSGEKMVSEIVRTFPLNEQQTKIEGLLCSYCGSSFENNLIRLK